MRIRIICVGKIKENFFTKAVEEYSKRQDTVNLKSWSFQMKKLRIMPVS